MDQQLTQREFERRAFIKRAGVVAGATVWAVPTVQSIASPAFAAGSPPPPNGECVNNVRFKFDNVSCKDGKIVGTFGDNGDGGPCAGDIEGYNDATLGVNSSGCYGGYCVQISGTCSGSEAKTATVTITNQGDLVDVVVKSGSKTGTCTEAAENGETFTVNLTQGISNIAGTFCVPA
jgi:hypothetical protein